MGPVKNLVWCWGSVDARDADAISGSCRADRVSTVSPLLSIMGLPVATAISDLSGNPRPARFLLPVALLPVPAWVHLPVFQDEFPRLW